MVLRIKFQLLLFLLAAITFQSCRQSKYVADGDYRYKIKKRTLPWNKERRTIHFAEIENDSIVNFSKSHVYLSVDDLLEITKPQPNYGFKLFLYNRIDSTRMNRQIERKKAHIDKVNQRKIDKQNAINKKRNDKAKTKGEAHYFRKVKRLRKIKKGWRHWMRNKVGEPPVLMDSVKVERSVQQLGLLLKNKGFYENEVYSSITYNNRRKKAYASYTIIAGQPYVIDTIKFDDSPELGGLRYQYNRMKKKGLLLIKPGDLLDHDLLDSERDKISKFCRDEAFFDFSKSYLYFEVDTIGKNHSADVTIKVIPRTTEDADGTVRTVGHSTYKVNAVTYYVHNTDEKSFKDYAAYEKKLEQYGRQYSGGDYPLLDTLNYVDSVFYKKFLLFGDIDTLVYRGTFIYNESLPVSPFLLDRQNFLEVTDGRDNGWYKEYYVERSYSKLLELDIFGSITPSVEYSDVVRRVDISYDLTPAKKQIFSFKPNATNSNGYLGLAATVNYTNKNLFGGAEKLRFSLTGGAESQPAVFDKTVDGEPVKTSGRQLNTIELYPKISLETPRLLPLSKNVQKTMSKRLYPLTIFELGYNYQKRADFTRNLTEFSYSWKFNEGKTKVHRVKWQSFNFVKLVKTEEFEILLEQLNDPFLSNTYNDHFSNKFEYTFSFNNQKENSKIEDDKRSFKKRSYTFTSITGSTSGYIFDKAGVGVADLNEDGLRQILGVPFTQFVRIDGDFRFYYNLNKLKTKSIAYRLLAGAGYAYGNSPSLPYEESFFAGGSNDIRAWNARTMAPGGIQTWKDTSSTLTQIGDMRLEMNLEYRFQFSPFVKMAFFIDAGNVWKIKDDLSTTEDDLGVFSSQFIEQIAIGSGLGLRLDFDFFIVRLDLSIPVHNPYMYAGERWLWEPRDLYESELETLPDTYTNSLRRPFAPTLSFGIGYPF